MFVGPYLNFSSSPLAQGLSGVASRTMTMVAVVDAPAGTSKVMVAQAEVSITNDLPRTGRVTGWTVCSKPAGADPMAACN
jgi:hypothetical protein